MEWKGRRESENVEDQRTLTPGRVAAGGGAGILILALLTYFLGGDPQEVLKLLQNNPQQAVPQDAPALNPAQDELKHFVSVVLADTEDVWRE
jgi:predicted metalloprotease